MPKSKSLFKTLFLISSFYFLPIWVIYFLAIVFYFSPFALSFSVISSLFALLFISYLFLGTIPSIIPFIFGAFFFALLGIKNVFFVHRLIVLYAFSGLLTFFAIYGFLLGVIPLFILPIIIFLLCRDIFAYSPLPSRSNFLSAVLAFIVLQTSWVISYFMISAFFGALAIFILFAGIFYALMTNLYGALFKSDAPFIALSSAIIAGAIIFLSAF